LASNPGGIGHDWVYKRFINPKTRHPGSAFLPSWLTDNPYLDRDDYVSSLEDALDDVTLAQLLGGDWTVRPLGGRFDRRWLKRDHLHESLPKEAPGWRWVRSWDLAASEVKEGADPDYTVGTLLGLDDSNDVWVADVERFRHDPGDTEQRIKAITDADRLRLPYLSVVMEQEPGAAGKTVIAHYEGVLWGSPFEGIPATGKKEVRAIPFSTAWRKGRLHVVVDDWTDEWLDEHEAFPFGGHDDQVDSATQAYNFLVAGAFEPGGASISPRPVQQLGPLRAQSPYASRRRLSRG
jgi:predicted phage terminase large subunit-like protein